MREAYPQITIRKIVSFENIQIQIVKICFDGLADNFFFIETTGLSILPNLVIVLKRREYIRKEIKPIANVQEF